MKQFKNSPASAESYWLFSSASQAIAQPVFCFPFIQKSEKWQPTIEMSE